MLTLNPNRIILPESPRGQQRRLEVRKDVIKSITHKVQLREALNFNNESKSPTRLNLCLLLKKHK